MALFGTEMGTSALLGPAIDVPALFGSAIDVPALFSRVLFAEVVLLYQLPPLGFALLEALVVLVVGSAFELSMRRLRGRGGLGLGDVKYLSAWTLLLGHHALYAFALACLCGALVALVRHQRDFALGPWISLCSVFIYCARVFFV